MLSMYAPTRDKRWSGLLCSVLLEDISADKELSSPTITQSCLMSSIALHIPNRCPTRSRCSMSSCEAGLQVLTFLCRPTRFERALLFEWRSAATFDGVAWKADGVRWCSAMDIQYATWYTHLPLFQQPLLASEQTSRLLQHSSNNQHRHQHVRRYAPSLALQSHALQPRSHKRTDSLILRMHGRFNVRLAP